MYGAERLGSRILVLGCPGSGKSTFAAKLHRRTQLPLVHLDNIWWNADRTHISRAEFDQKLEALLRNPAWIIDGDYSRTYEVRVAACDTAVFLDLSEAECMDGITRRVGKQRPDIPWAEQTLDPELVALVRDYRKTNRPTVQGLMARYPEKQWLVFQSRAEADAWLAALPARD